MKSSKSKRKLVTEDICREYYESQLFRPTGNDEVSPSGFFASASIDLESVDDSFKGIDFNTFLKEMITVNIELFGLAWLTHNYDANQELPKPESFFLEEITATKQYLQDTGRGDYWERMGFYNDVIADTVAEQTISESWGRLRDIPKAIRDEDYEEVQEKFLIEEAKLLTDMLSKCTTDSECRDRLVFRFLAVPCNISEITVLSQKLSLKLTERLGCTPKQAGLFALQKVIVGLYSNAVNYLDAVRQYGSYEAYKDTRRALLQGLKRVAREHHQK
jgi:hypothetical protein